MDRSGVLRNTYEESPDDLKGVSGRSKQSSPRVGESRLTRETLLEHHEKNLKLLIDGDFQPRNFILPAPYPPSRTSLPEARRIRLADLRHGHRDSESMLLLRAIVEPYVHSASITIVEDEDGEVARLTVCNLEDSMHDPVLVKGKAVAVKQPCWSSGLNGDLYIRVDHPSDLVLLDAASDLLPAVWKKLEDGVETRDNYELKKEGDALFLKKKFRAALEMYGRAVMQTRAIDMPAHIDCHRKRCGVNIVLLRFDDAAEDLTRAIAVHTTMSSSLQDSNLVDQDPFKQWLQSRSSDDPLGLFLRLPRPLKDLAARIRYEYGIYQDHCDYDFSKIVSAVGPLSMHVDATTYICDTEVRPTRRHGRGLFAKRDFKAGDLVMGEKAFGLPGYFFNDRSSDCSLYSLTDGTAADRNGALLYRELVQKLTANPSLRKEFFSMDDGGYWEEHGCEIGDGEDIPVDVFRVEHIRRRNCFAAPLRAIDVLKRPTPVRNGFWIHTSYINHSCLPNSVRTFLGDMLFLRATRDIAVGEEITAQYVTPELTYDDRQSKYKSTWNFECDCDMCEVDRKTGAKIERDRMQLFEELKGAAQKLGEKPTFTALKKFAKRLRDLEALYSADAYAELPKLCLVHPTLFLTEAWRGLNNTDKTIEYATRLLRYFGVKAEFAGDTFTVAHNAGLINVECVRALKYLAEAYTSKAQHNLASSITSTAQIWFRIITGTDVGSKEFLS